MVQILKIKPEGWRSPPTIGYTLHRGGYGGPPSSVARFLSDGRHLLTTYGTLSEKETVWLMEYLPTMHGTAEKWGCPRVGVVVADA